MTAQMLPTFFTLVRHGQSEANIAQKKLRYGDFDGVNIPEDFGNRHDSYMRLSSLGVEQAQAAGEWLRAQPDFDRFYVSPHIRTQETAANLGLNGEWRVDDRFRERDWGSVFSHEPMPDDVKKMRKLHDWYWQPPLGESLATGVRIRVESVMNTLYRRGTRQHNVLAVTHGEFIRTAQFVIERLSPQAWVEMDEGDDHKVQNTMIVQYTSTNPQNPEDVHSHYAWRRAICPWDRSLDWDNGQWVTVKSEKASDAGLMDAVNAFPRLLS